MQFSECDSFAARARLPFLGELVIPEGDGRSELKLQFRVPDPSADEQVLWRARDVAAACFETDRRDALKGKFADILPHARVCHQKIWHGIECPEGVPFETRIQTNERPSRETQLPQELWLPTSLMLASVVWMASHVKRGARPRFLAYRVLKAIVAAACGREGLSLDVLFKRMDGSVEWGRRLLQAVMSIADLCDVEFFQQQFAAVWGFELNNTEVPWIAHPAERPHVADWICFCLDQPVSLQRVGKVLLQSKKCMEESVLYIVAQLAHAVDANAMLLGRAVAKKGQRKMSKLTAWSLTGLATEALVAGRDT